MEISKSLLNATYITLKAIFKASDADIRVHDEHLIPNEPVLYTVNHFTRLETMLMPYIIRKYTGKLALSLAHHSFYGGGFGKLLNKLGAISTKDPDRDRLIVRTLLLGDMSVIIFPEGQMIKDKKIIEKGKYLVYNAGVVRPPHTGAGRIALRAEFYRMKIKEFMKSGNKAALDEIKKHLELTDADLKKITVKKTCIVPVNITYFPIRARMNALTRLAGKFMKSVPVRMEEELEVEGTILFEETDIDINFGQPIYMEGYLNSSGKIMDMVSDEHTYLRDDEFDSSVRLDKISLKIMYEYMSSIYNMTTVNHDHIFSYITAMYPKSKMPESDLKNRAYLAIKAIQGLRLANQHTSLDKKQKYLLTDDFHDKYQSFIDVGISDGLFSVKDGVIHIDKTRFNRPYKFHTIRMDNIIEVCKNEIEPQREVMKILHKIMLTSPSSIRRRLRKYFAQKDQRQFEEDYKKYYRSGESKPEHIGRPFMLKPFCADKGVILVHGYMAAPEEMRPLAEFLRTKGYAVYCARLSGHGTSPEDLATRTWPHWYDTANRAYIVMKNTVKKVAVVGFSTGSGIALMQAISKGNNLSAVVSINAPLKLHNFATHLTPALNMWNKMLGKFNISKGKMEFIPNRPDNPDINYFRNPVSGVYELTRLMDAVEENLGRIVCPALVIQGSGDPVVKAESASIIYGKIKAQKKEIYEVRTDRHGIVRGPGSEKTFERVHEFLKANM